MPVCVRVEEGTGSSSTFGDNSLSTVISFPRWISLVSAELFDDNKFLVQDRMNLQQSRVLFRPTPTVKLDAMDMSIVDI